MPKIEVRIAEPNFAFGADALNVYVIMSIDETTRKIMHMDLNGFVAWDEIEYPAQQVQPTIVLQNDIAILFRDALVARYQGASDINTIRADLMHERSRVDKCMEVLLSNNKALPDIIDKLAEG
jgi:hypothetical protein